jgi:hypothetical protein
MFCFIRLRKQDSKLWQEEEVYKNEQRPSCLIITKGVRSWLHNKKGVRDWLAHASIYNIFKGLKRLRFAY